MYPQTTITIGQADKASAFLPVEIGKGEIRILETISII
jgi:hypothetical protein